MVHISSDDDKAAASKWAGDVGFPWLTILPEDAEASGLNKLSTGFVPDYVLVKASGEKVGTGMGIFDQVKSL